MKSLLCLHDPLIGHSVNGKHSSVQQVDLEDNDLGSGFSRVTQKVYVERIVKGLKFRVTLKRVWPHEI
jgi:hypothetical protein